eukprot:scaffold2763_cov161-Pinguiococcus_pyrenoidosus.AAC.1
MVFKRGRSARVEEEESSACVGATYFLYSFLRGQGATMIRHTSGLIRSSLEEKDITRAENSSSGMVGVLELLLRTTESPESLSTVRLFVRRQQAQKRNNIGLSNLQVIQHVDPKLLKTQVSLVFFHLTNLILEALTHEGIELQRRLRRRGTFQNIIAALLGQFLIGVQSQDRPLQVGQDRTERLRPRVVTQQLIYRFAESLRRVVNAVE